MDYKEKRYNRNHNRLYWTKRKENAVDIDVQQEEQKQEEPLITEQDIRDMEKNSLEVIDVLDMFIQCSIEEGFVLSTSFLRDCVDKLDSVKMRAIDILKTREMQGNPKTNPGTATPEGISEETIARIVKNVTENVVDILREKGRI